MSEKLDRIIDALEIIGQQQDAIVEALAPIASLETAMNLQNRVSERMEGSIRENTVSVQALRRDIEYLRKNGCERSCPPDEPDTSPTAAKPQLRVMGATLGGE